MSFFKKLFGSKEKAKKEDNEELIKGWAKFNIWQKLYYIILIALCIYDLETNNSYNPGDSVFKFYVTHPLFSIAFWMLVLPPWSWRRLFKKLK